MDRTFSAKLGRVWLKERSAWAIESIESGQIYWFNFLVEDDFIFAFSFSFFLDLQK